MSLFVQFKSVCAILCIRLEKENFVTYTGMLILMDNNLNVPGSHLIRHHCCDQYCLSCKVSIYKEGWQNILIHVWYVPVSKGLLNVLEKLNICCFDRIVNIIYIAMRPLTDGGCFTMSLCHPPNPPLSLYKPGTILFILIYSAVSLTIQ